MLTLIKNKKPPTRQWLKHDPIPESPRSADVNTEMSILYWHRASNAVHDNESDLEQEIEDFKKAVYALCKADQEDEAIMEAMTFFNRHLRQRQFSKCAKVLNSLEVEKLARSVMVSILGITIRAKKLAGRDEFYSRSYTEIARQKGNKYARDMLTKYR